MSHRAARRRRRRLAAPRTLTEALGLVLSDERLMRGLTQAEMGAAVGVAQTTWCRIELGSHSISVRNLATACRMFLTRPTSADVDELDEPLTPASCLQRAQLVLRRAGGEVGLAPISS